MSADRVSTNDEEPIVTCSELLEQIDDEEEELDRERALYGNCDVDTCTYPQVYKYTPTLTDCFSLSGIRPTTGSVHLHDVQSI
jgi:hypothetical protein